MKITEFEETIKKFSAIQNYAPFVTFFFLNGSHLTLRTFKQYVVKHSSGNENVAIFSFGINRGGVERENIAISINAVKAIQFFGNNPYKKKAIQFFGNNPYKKKADE